MNTDKTPKINIIWSSYQKLHPKTKQKTPPPQYSSELISNKKNKENLYRNSLFM